MLRKTVCAAVMAVCATPSQAAPTSPVNRWLCNMLLTEQDPVSAMKAFPLEKLTVEDSSGMPGGGVIGRGKTYLLIYGPTEVFPGESGPLWQVNVPREHPERKQFEAVTRAWAEEWGPLGAVRQGITVGREMKGPGGAYAAVLHKGATLSLYWRSNSQQLAQSLCR